MKNFEQPEQKEDQSFFYEIAVNINGKKVKRIKSDLFYLLSVLSLVTGVVLLVNNKLIGFFFLFTVFPILLIYPAVRFFLGGKDSVAGVVATVVVEEVLKHKLTSKIDNRRKEKGK
jgi:ABC-type branched-subunit amino acid transport system permease subunit